MSVKAGKFLTIGNGVLVDRLQQTGAGNVNVPTERILETGNELAVATVRDTPELSYDMESLDCTIEPEAMLVGLDEGSIADGQILNFADAKPFDAVSPIKGSGTSKTSTRGVIVPQLQLESASYRFGVRANATQTFTLRGDAQYTIPGTPYRQVFDVAGAGGVGPYTLTNTAIKVVEKGQDVYAVSVCVLKADGSYERLFHGVDYTDTSTTVTLASGKAPAGSKIAICYGSTTSATFPQTIHPTPSVKPAAVRGKDIDLYVGTGPSVTATFTTTTGDATITGDDFSSAWVGYTVEGTGIPEGTTILTVDGGGEELELSDDATASGTVTVTLRPPLIRWAGVQSVELNWRVQLETEDELGNPHHVASDYDVPEVSGSITMRPVTIEYLFDRIAQIANVPTNEIAGLLSSAALELQVRISHPETGARLKTFRVRDARIVPPGLQARVNQKLEPQFQWSSDTGLLEIIKGEP